MVDIVSSLEPNRYRNSACASAVVMKYFFRKETVGTRGTLHGEHGDVYTGSGDIGDVYVICATGSATCLVFQHGKFPYCQRKKMKK